MGTWTGGRGARALAIGVGAALLAATGFWETAKAEDRRPLCTAPAPGEPMFVSERCDDPRFNDGYAFVDLDVVRDLPIPHRVVTGGFRGTDLRFAFYFPPAEQYRGRFIHGPVHQLRLTGEVASQEEMEFAFASGAYLVNTNNGGTDVCLVARDGARSKCDAAIVGYRAGAAAAKFSKQIAKEVYGTTKRPYGYLYGGSGGAYMSLAAAENTDGVWDGFVPFVMGDPQALVAHFSARAHALRVLGDKMRDVVDAMDPGGSGNPYATLSPDQAAALRETTRMGYPLRGWFNYETVARASLTMITSDYVKLIDPTYIEDFWTKGGYLGTERTSAGDAIRRARVRHDATVVASVPANPPAPLATPTVPYTAFGPAYPAAAVAQYAVALPPKAFVLDSMPTGGDLLNAYLVVTSGPISGQSCPLAVVDHERRIVQCGPNSDPDIVNGIGTGDSVRIDNSFFLAFQTQPRHELPPAEWGVYSYDQYRNPNGSPRYPQRGVFPGVFGTKAGAGSVADGRFFGKVIVVNTLIDQEAYPFPADWYRRKAAQHLGAKVDERLRVYFVDNATHGGVPDATRIVDYGPVLQQALRDLAAWVERGVAPPPSTNYTVDGDTQVQVPATATERRGLQPAVELKVNGRTRVDVAAGDTVNLSATIEAPPGTGKIVCVEWDPAGSGDFGGESPLSGLSPVTSADPTGTLNQPIGGSAPACAPVDAAARVTATLTHTFTEPGTYFAVVRGTAQRDGDAETPWGRIQNLARVRIVVR